MRNFREVMSGIDVRPLLDQVAAHPELWNIDDVATRNKPNCELVGVSDIILRYPQPTPLGSMPCYDRPAFGLLPAAQQIIFDLMHAVRGEHLGNVVISRMLSGQVIKPHIDLMPYINPERPELGRIPPYYQRFQIPLSVSPGCVFRCGDEELYMEPGRAYFFNNQALHAVHNDSPDYRISMRTDIRPFGF